MLDVFTVFLLVAEFRRRERAPYRDICRAGSKFLTEFNWIRAVLGTANRSSNLRAVGAIPGQPKGFILGAALAPGHHRGS